MNAMFVAPVTMLRATLGSSSQLKLSSLPFA
jgi:hypothetical protein